MTKWTSIAVALLALAVVAANASPITNDGASHKVMGRQGDAAPSAEVVTSAPAAPAAAAAASEEEDDDDDDDDDDFDIEDALDDDDDDDDEEDDDEAEDDDDDDDEDYLDRFFDDILADDDDDDDDDAPPKPKPSKAPAAVTSAPTASVETGSKSTPKPPTAVEADSDEDYADDDDDDDDEDSVSAGSTDNEVKKPGESGGLADLLGDDDEDDEDDDDEAGAEKDEGDDDEEEEDDEAAADDEEEDDDDEDDLTSKRSRALKGEDIPAAHVVQYNGFVDQIMGKINEVLKKTFDPVSIKLTRGSQVPPSRKPTKSDPKVHTLENASGVGPAYDVIDLTKDSDESEAPLTRTKRVRSQRSRTIGNSGNRKKNKNKTQQRAQRAHATLIGLSSVRRDGDVQVNKFADHSTIKSNFLIGPLVLRVEKAFGRGAKKELRSATATTDKMGGRLVLRVNQTGVASLHTIRVLQPKQVRVESDDDHEQTREFVWRRSSHIARVVSQKLTKAAREMLSGLGANQQKLEHH